MKIEGNPHGALWTQLLSCASNSLRRIRDAADRRIVQAHGTADLGETIAVVEMCPSNGVIPSYPVGSSPGAEQLAQRRSSRKPLSPRNLFQEALISEPGRRSVNRLCRHSHISEISSEAIEALSNRA